jgi:dolichol-phosphate mannosyltransferase
MSFYEARKSSLEELEFFESFTIAAVIPVYNEERKIEGVIKSIPFYISHIVIVDDASTDQTGNVLKKITAEDQRINLIRHKKNQGVGGATISGFYKALQLGAQVVVKIDGDGQMPLEYLPHLLWPLIYGEADYTKGNRFHDFKALRQMGVIRRSGNLALSFLAKIATGYWDCFDPTNGFFAIRGEVLSQLPLNKIDKSYFFEHSMLGYLYLSRALIRDIPIPAQYGDEISHLSISRELLSFPPRLITILTKRLILKNFLYDFTMESIYLLIGLPLFLSGVIYGGYNWVHYSLKGVGAPTGTVVISALLLILGFQIILSAIEMDLRSTPCKPRGKGPLKISNKIKNEDTRSIHALEEFTESEVVTAGR